MIKKKDVYNHSNVDNNKEKKIKEREKGR